MAEDTGIEKLIRPHFKALGAYSPCKSPDTMAEKLGMSAEDIIKLDANENPYGCSPRVKEVLAKYPFFNLYPDAGQTEIRKQLAAFTGMPVENIVAGSGSDELIDLLLRLFLEPGDEVINCVPTFDMYRFSTQICGGKVIEVVRRPDFTVNVEAVKVAINKRTKMLFIANPNNPTGTLVPKNDIMELAETGIPLVIDEAYYEFSGQTVVSLMAQYENLIVLRTFSKWAGLAGLRVGYGFFTPKITDYLLKIKPPYNVNAAALVAVRESIKDADYLLGTVKRMIAERERLFAELSKLSFLKPIPSRANFILCAVLKGEATVLQQELQDRGILARYYDTPLLRNYIRFSVGKPEHTDVLMKALREIEERTSG